MRRFAHTRLKGLSVTDIVRNNAKVRKTREEGLVLNEATTVPIHLKAALTIREAAEYSNIGINRIDAMLRQPNCPFVLFVGTRKLVKRREFEDYISRTFVI